VIAGVNVMSAGFIVGSGAVVAGLQALGVGPALICLGLGLAGLAALAVVLRAWGREGVRDTAAILFRAFYRIEVEGLENLPAQGTRMVIAPNHISFLDPAIVHAVLPIDAMFAADTTIASQWWFRPFHWLVRVYKIDPTKPFSARALVNIVKEGNPLVIFPEGRITVTGGLMKVYDGTAMIADKGDAVVVPVRIEGPEQTGFAYLRGTQMKRTWFPKIRVKILPPVKLSVDPGLKGRARRLAAGAVLQDVMVDAEVTCAHVEQTLFEALDEARRNRDTGKPILQDPLGASLGYRKLMLGAQVLSKKLEPLSEVGDAVGVMLPNAAGVVVTFFALQTIGRVPAMINFTAGPLNVLAAMKAAKVQVLLTSRAFVERGRLDKLIAELEGKVRIVYLEDVRQTIGTMDKLAGFAAGTRPRVPRKPDDPAVILFTSGSEGTPKGVVLSHRNILVNASQALSRVAVNGEDKVFNVLPVFHSFGLTGGLIMPLVAGVPIYLYPSPLHYRIVPELIYQTNATILFGTDTFLNGYARAAHCYDFRSVRIIMAGAEAVKERTRQVYAERFGVRVLEGYGVTETSPVLAINSEIANKAGSVGRLSPLMQWRLEPVPGIAEGGRLFVKGPNVMLGYLRADNPGVLEAPPDGWYDTGDIVTIDAQGFITIRGRAKRFAKVAGEMVSLSAVEAMVAAEWPTAMSCVVSVPDPRKGERLVLLTTQKDAARDQLSRAAKAKGLSELSVPAEIMVVDKLPVLGSGKTDYVTATAQARERAAAKAEAAGGSSVAA